MQGGAMNRGWAVLGRHRALLLAPLLALMVAGAGPARAATADATDMSSAEPAANSAPEWRAPRSNIPDPRDTPFPGTMRLMVDASDVARGIFQVEQAIPVPDAARREGQMVLLYPEWLPGNHAPRGEIEKLAGLGFTAGGMPLA